jgi:hypothetical protein
LGFGVWSLRFGVWSLRFWDWGVVRGGHQADDREECAESVWRVCGEDAESVYYDSRCKAT